MTTKLEELKAACDATGAVLDDAIAAARAAVAFDGYDSFGAASDAVDAASGDYEAARHARDDAREAYIAELERLQEENSND